jgi:hypothetical protein
MHSFYRRTFLNRRGHHAGAYVLADISVERDVRGEAWIDAVLTVADCNRIANLDFTFSTPAARDNAVHKARLLRDVVVAFAAALEEAASELDS